MTDFKIRPPTGPQTPQSTTGPEGATQTEGKTFSIEQGTEANSAVTETSESTDPEVVVDRLKAGEINYDQAIDLLIAHAMGAEPVAEVPEALRNHIQNALEEMLQSDPTMASLTSFLKR